MIRKNIMAGALALVMCVSAAFLTSCTAGTMADGTTTTTKTTTTTRETTTESESTLIGEIGSDIMDDVSDATHGTTEAATEKVGEVDPQGAHRMAPRGK